METKKLISTRFETEAKDESGMAYSKPVASVNPCQFLDRNSPLFKFNNKSTVIPSGHKPRIWNIGLLDILILL